MPDDDLLTQLRSAAVRPDLVDQRAAVGASQRRRRRHRITGGVATAVVIIVALAIALPLTRSSAERSRPLSVTAPTAPVTRPATEQATSHGVTASFTVANPRAGAGTAIDVQIIVTNATGHPLPTSCHGEVVPCGTDDLIDVPTSDGTGRPVTVQGWTYEAACTPGCPSTAAPFPGGVTTISLTIRTGGAAGVYRLGMDASSWKAIPLLPFVPLTLSRARSSVPLAGTGSGVFVPDTDLRVPPGPLLQKLAGLGLRAKVVDVAPGERGPGRIADRRGPRPRSRSAERVDGRRLRDERDVADRLTFLCCRPRGRGGPAVAVAHQRLSPGRTRCPRCPA